MGKAQTNDINGDNNDDEYEKEAINVEIKERPTAYRNSFSFFSFFFYLFIYSLFLKIACNFTNVKMFDQTFLAIFTFNKIHLNRISYKHGNLKENKNKKEQNKKLQMEFWNILSEGVCGYPLTKQTKQQY